MWHVDLRAAVSGVSVSAWGLRLIEYSVKPCSSHLLLIRNLMSVSFTFPSRTFSVLQVLKCPWDISRCGPFFVLSAWLLLAPFNLAFFSTGKFIF